MWYKQNINKASAVKKLMSAHKVKSHIKERAQARAVKKSSKKSQHQIHADNLYKLAHPENPKRQKVIKRSISHVALPIVAIVATASLAVGAQVVRNNNVSTKAAPAVPANSVCRVFNENSGGLAAQDSRIGMTLDNSTYPKNITFSGLKLNYLYAADGSFAEYSLADVSNSKLKTLGDSFIYVKACAVNPGPAMPPFTSRAALVDQQYRDFFKRNATAAEQTKWAGKNPATGQNYTAREILDWFVENDAAKRGPMVRLYKAYYKRWPDQSGYDYWIRKMQNGASLASVSDYFAQSSEFKRTYGSLTNKQFVALVYDNVLGRPGDQAGMDYWLRRLDQKKISRGGLMAQFSESSEFTRKYGLDCDLVGVTLRMLRRPATPAELAEWNPDETAETLASPIIFESSEYANRVVK